MVDDDCIINQPSSLEGSSVTFDLCDNVHYSFEADICIPGGKVKTLSIPFSNYYYEVLFWFPFMHNNIS